MARGKKKQKQGKKKQAEPQVIGKKKGGKKK